MSDGKKIVVVGGGIAGLTAAIEAAEAGASVLLLERESFLGGRAGRFSGYFPKLCVPACGLEIQYRRIRSNPAIEVMVSSEPAEITGKAGNYTVTVRTRPRTVNDKCTLCGKCEPVCPVSAMDKFNYGMREAKAIHVPTALSYPQRAAIDQSACRGVGCSVCATVCEYGAIELDAKGTTTTVSAAAVIYATGWTPYDHSRLTNLGGGKLKNVITNVMMERLLDPLGPTGGKVLRPSDGREAKSAVFVQCAGSRDENHLEHCSAVCCLASVKHAAKFVQSVSESAAKILYIDLRAHGKYEKFMAGTLASNAAIKAIKGKAAKIAEDPSTGEVVVTAEDVMAGKKTEHRCDIVVLATGMQASSAPDITLPLAKTASGGFMPQGIQQEGIFIAGVASRPMDVSSAAKDATAAALGALTIWRRG